MAGLVSSPGGDSTVLKGRNSVLSLDRPHVVGILNVTPDSFSDGGHFSTIEKALEQGRLMADAGASIIDIGGESTRPGAPRISVDEELDRVIPVIKALQLELTVPLSIDTSKSQVAAAAIEHGVDFVNDISGLTFDSEMAKVVAGAQAGLIVMHTRGRPDVMQRNTDYVDIVGEVTTALQESINAAVDAGVDREKIVVDPGIGFGKSVSGNLELLRRVADLQVLGCPVMLGTSRKSFIGRVLGYEDPRERMFGTLATLALGYAGGARLFRVHDVAAARDAVLMAEAVCKGADWAAG